jgi:eukaryotic-like serine/threonine-protein kinase
MRVDSRELPGRTIAGKYLVKRRIGAGGMGAVYEGEHVEIGKRVAIKVIDHEHAKSEELAQRFRREARAASSVESEHIVHVFDVGQDPDVGLYMVMEILSGMDLATRLEQCGGALPLEEATTILLQTARGLAKAHAAGVVHRDLKPANLFLTKREDGSPCVKVLDFGISKLTRRDDDTSKSKGQSLTREGVVIGTPQYMSPEQAQGLPVDARTDVWSLGAVAYEVFSGKPLFGDRDTYEQMIVQIVTTKPKPLVEVAPHVPREIAAVVDAALTHDASSRLADCGAFAARLADAARLPRSSDPDLANAATQLALNVSPTPAKTNEGVVLNTAAKAAASKRTILYAGIGAAALVVAASALIVSRRSEPTPSVGIIAAPPPAENAKEDAKESSVPTSVTKVLPVPTEVTPMERPVESSAPSAAAVKLPPKPAAKPTREQTTKPAAHGGTQYGAPGVSTVY